MLKPMITKVSLALTLGLHEFAVKIVHFKYINFPIVRRLMAVVLFDLILDKLLENSFLLPHSGCALRPFAGQCWRGLLFSNLNNVTCSIRLIGYILSFELLVNQNNMP